MAIARKSTKKPSAATATKAPARGRTKVDAPPSRPAHDDDDEGQGRSSSPGLEVDAEVLAFIEALDRFKKANHRQFPSWSEVLFVLKDLGYRKG